MKCWSCHKEILDSAVFCPYCEAEAMDEPSPEQIAEAEAAIASMAPEVVDEIRDVFEKSSSGEEFVNRLMVGDCPKCGKANTGDCEDDPEIDDPCIGRCFDCGQLWCLDCGEFFQDAKSVIHDCPFWEDFDDEDSTEEDFSNNPFG